MSASEGFVDPWPSFLQRYHAGTVNAAQLSDWQAARLMEVLEHAQAHSPFYSRRLADVDLSAVHPSSMEALPFTTKQDLSEQMYDMLSGDLREGLFFFSTTGTTGRSTPCPRSRRDVELDNWAVTRSLGDLLHDWLGPDARPVLAMLCPNETHSVCLTTSAAATELGLLKFDAFPLSPVIGFERVFELLQQLRADVVIGAPGQLMGLAELGLRYGVDVGTLDVAAVLTTGELCTPSMAALLARTWRARACNWWYGSQEAGTSVLARPDGVMVPVEANYVVEVVDVVTGRPLGDEGRGELCLTNLVAGLKPLVRYRTGDVVDMRREASGARALQMLGRIKDMVVLGGVQRSAHELETAVLGDHGLVRGYELEIDAPDGDDTLLLKVKATPGSDAEEVAEAVRAAVRDEFAVPCEVQVLQALSGVTATGGWVSWKTARVRDLRPAPPDALELLEARSATDMVEAAAQRK